ncbi:MAG: hypothetical protein JWQ71_239 [Pedosphaera sp.]|nr:hypothetical protein [Pedosphaera sp.]
MIFVNMNHRILAGWVAGCMLTLISAGEIQATTAGDEMANAANTFLNALTSEQQAKATFQFKDEERYDWHFVPKSRKGLPFKEMTGAQQKLAHALLCSGLSQRGYAKATTIMSLEEVLAGIEKGKGPNRDADMYFFTIFGTPGTETWGWRLEGHHLSLNFVVRGDKVLSATPAFYGTNPGEVREGPRKGLRLLGQEEDLGRQLVKSLSAEQQKVAIFTTNAPKEIITGNQRTVKALGPDGLSAGKMTKAQKELLLTLVKEYAFRHRTEVAEADLKKIEHSGWDKVHFAWAGGLERGMGHYYRIQGPTFLLEYDNTQNNANHVHSVWRDFENDFGEDVLKKHYEEVPHGK